MSSRADSAQAVSAQLAETRRAFDSVAPNYDGPRGNNVLVQRMRESLWRAVASEAAPPARLLDIGCGTGIDAVHFAESGFEVLATDLSPRMIQRTSVRIKRAGVSGRARVMELGVQDLATLDDQRFDLIYSDLGPINCAPDLLAVSCACAELLRPGGKLILSVIGRRCPWELAYYAMRGNFARARVRARKGHVAVGLNGHWVWAAYYTPRELLAVLSGHFRLLRYRALGLFLPPPYLIRVHERVPSVCRGLGWLDDHLGHLRILRDMGDHFLMILAKRVTTP